MTMLDKRTFLSLALAAALGAAVQAQAQVLAAPKILEALSAKDIVLDQPGAAHARPAAAIDLQVQFAFDSAELLPQGRRQLDQLAIALHDKALLLAGFQLAGHTDKVGDADYNVKLSLARAEAVKAYLNEMHGIAPERLQTLGLGYARLLDPAHPTAALNRRVEVRRLAVPLAMAEPAPSIGRLVPTPR